MTISYSPFSSSILHDGTRENKIVCLQHNQFFSSFAEYYNLGALSLTIYGGMLLIIVLW